MQSPEKEHHGLKFPPKQVRLSLLCALPGVVTCVFGCLMSEHHQGRTEKTKAAPLGNCEVGLKLSPSGSWIHGSMSLVPQDLPILVASSRWFLVRKRLFGSPLRVSPFIGFLRSLMLST